MWANFAKYGYDRRGNKIGVDRVRDNFWQCFHFIRNPTPKNKNRMVNWIDSGKDGLQLDINTVPRMHERFTDKKEEDFERLYYRILPLVSSCVEQPTQFFDFV